LPKLYEYFGLVVLFYSNEHEPVHVHGLFQGLESRAELVVKNGVVVDVKIGDVKGRRPLDSKHLADFRLLVERYGDDIVRKWVDFFVLHKSVKAKQITRRLK